MPEANLIDPARLGEHDGAGGPGRGSARSDLIPVESGPDLLRRAAALMRKRAESCGGAGWEWPATLLGLPNHSVVGATGAVVAIAKPHEAEHVASWHPAVAVTVADLLERDAEDWEQLAVVMPRATAEGEEPFVEAFAGSLTVARTYLGDPGAGSW